MEGRREGEMDNCNFLPPFTAMTFDWSIDSPIREGREKPPLLLPPSSALSLASQTSLMLLKETKSSVLSSLGKDKATQEYGDITKAALSPSANEGGEGEDEDEDERDEKGCNDATTSSSPATASAKKKRNKKNKKNTSKTIVTPGSRFPSNSDGFNS